MGMGQSAIRRPTQQSNIEFVSALRASFEAAQRASKAHDKLNGNGVSHEASAPPSAWTSFSEYSETCYIPSLEYLRSGLREERSSYEITVKLFFLPGSPASMRSAQAREAIQRVLDALKVPSVDLLILSYPGIAFDADDEAGELDPAEEALQEPSQAEAVSESSETLLSTWHGLEELQLAGAIGRLGVAEFGVEKLNKFLSRTRVKPSVDQINVRDCCVVPKPLILFAKEHGVELLTHNDCTDILPPGTVRELLGVGKGGFGLLKSGNNSQEANTFAGNVTPQWVVKYTAVVKNRGVVENKGYFALAELSPT